MIEILPFEFQPVAGADVQICDPPYSAHVHENATSTGNDGRGPVDRDLGFKSLTDELRDLIAAQAAECKRWSIVFSDWQGVGVAENTESTAVRLAGWVGAMYTHSVEYVRPVAWVRWSQPQISGDRPPSGSEAVLVFHSQHVGPRGGVKPKPKRWNGSGGRVCYDSRSLRGDDKHPTEKPFDLMLDLVSEFSDPGELVVDGTAGRGTTALACAVLGRDCAAFERNPDEAARAQSRVRTPLSLRDRARAEEWIVRTEEQCAKDELQEPSENIVRRILSRRADTERVFEALSGKEFWK